MPENVLVLLFHALTGIEQQQAHIALINGLDRPDRAVELQTVIHLPALPQTSRIHDFKIETKGIVTRMHTVRVRTRDIGDDVPLLPNSVLIKVLFPTFGRPTTDKLGKPKSSGSSLAGNNCTNSSSKVTSTISIVGTDSVQYVIPVPDHKTQQ